MTPTRQQYMNNECSFADFYRAVNATAGFKIMDNALIERVRKALADGDEHLNTIPLRLWDSMAIACSSTFSRALKEHGDFYSLAGGVCCLKQAAKDAANG